jgi:hypothetical protein
LWLRLGGADGVKEALKAFLEVNLNGPALHRLMQTGGEARLGSVVAQITPGMVDGLKRASPA